MATLEFTYEEAASKQSGRKVRILVNTTTAFLLAILPVVPIHLLA